MNKTADFILSVYKNTNTVFTFNELGLMIGETGPDRLKQKVNYYVRNRKLLNIRKGIYAKEGYNPEELACKIITPAYISLEYVLLKAGAIFQYSDRFTVVSYLSRSFEVDSHHLDFRRIKGSILINTKGIERRQDGVNIATPERALLDILYLEKDFYLDNPAVIKPEAIRQLMPIYHSKSMMQRVNRLLAL